MNSWIVSQVADLLSGNITVVKDVHAYTGNSKAITWKVKAMNGTEAADLNGAKCTVYVIREDQVTVVVEGTISGNLCEAVFKKECFAVPGVVKCLMNLTYASDTEFTVSAFEFVNGNGPTDKLVDPGEVLDINAALEAAKGAVRFDVEQQLTEAQKETARKNLDVGVGYAKQEDVEKIINREPQFFSVEGNPVQFESFAGVKLAPVTVLEPRQEGSGDPYPAGGGRNLLNVKRLLTPDGNASNINVTLTGSILTLEGTPTGAFSQIQENNIIDAASLIGKAITFSGILGGQEPYIAIQCKSANATLTTIALSQTGAATGIVPEGTTKIAIAACLNQSNYVGSACKATYENLQLEIGSSATEYQPWENIRPFIGYDKLDLNVTGKNLFPVSSLNSTYSDNIYTQDKPFSLPAGQYTLSFKSANATTTAMTLALFAGETKVKEIHVIAGGTQTTFTLDSAVDGLVWYVREAVHLTNIQLELGSSVTSFIPYAGKLHTVQLGQTVYGGKFDWLTGKLVAEWAMRTLDGTENWKRWHSTAQYLEFDGIAEVTSYSDNSSISHCDTLAISDHALIQNNKAPNSIAPIYGMHGIFISIAGIGDVDALKAWLAQTPVSFAYKLATPIEIQLTPTEIIALSGVNTLYGDGHITVTGRTDIGGVFDSDNDGYVDYAANAGKLGGQAPSHYAKADHGHGVGHVSGAFPAASYDGLIVKNGNPVTEILKAGRGITAVTTIEPQQEGSGDPYPAGGGRNLCVLPDVESVEVYGITFSCSNGVVKTKGTATANASTGATISYHIPKGTSGTYFVSGSSGGTRVFVKIDKDGASSYPHQQSFTLDGTETNAMLFIQVNAGYTVDDTVYPMLNAGTTVLPWEAPSNIRPFIGYDKLNLNHAGKNIYNPSEAISKGNFEHHGVTGTWRDDGDLILNGTLTSNAWQSIGTSHMMSGKTYTVSVSGNVMVAVWDRVADVFVGNATLGTPFTFTAASTGTYAYAIASVTGASFADERVMLMVAEGSVATGWQPYQGTLHTVQIGQTVYGGRFDWLTGKLVAEWVLAKGVFTRATLDSSGKLYAVTGIPSTAKPYPTTQEGLYEPYIVCTALLFKTLEAARRHGKPCITQYGTEIYIGGYIGKEAELDALLASDDFAVAYKLATPIEIDLSAQAAGVIEALEGINTVYGDGDLEVTFNHDRLLTLMWNKLMLTT